MIRIMVRVMVMVRVVVRVFTEVTDDIIRLSFFKARFRNFIQSE